MNIFKLQLSISEDIFTERRPTILKNHGDFAEHSLITINGKLWNIIEDPGSSILEDEVKSRRKITFCIERKI
jgi:hypothetical protein